MHPDSSQMARAWLEPLTGGIQRFFDAGEVISRPDSGDNRLFRLQTGSARIFLTGEQRELTLGCLNPGCVYVTHTRAWVAALESCSTISWPLDQLTRLITDSPELAVQALREVGLMLHQAINLIEDLAFRSVESRLARYLLLELDNQGGHLLRLPGNTGLLASLLGTSRQTLSTVINRLIRDGLLERPDRHHLLVLDSRLLQQLADTSSLLSAG
ncbi:Crp/Fnr family transcriptional regulator [Parathalassolituus penaei]|uniref:Crp/Fnr family transcriptional regulator n=1 Tax=Parathalassolituus penaei TaxID=2997323 RepID=A0A9X3IVN1_9GAMM|nr:Crp/Fnr family transcriptional regulator [Parathalassolituus penaei]MCY0967418.1 Crp/Fnr family transcriptional regulator [Parathalassolituus penaei]